MNYLEKCLRTSTINAFFIICARCIADFGSVLSMIALSSYVFVISNNVYQFSMFMVCSLCGSLFSSVISLPFFRKMPGKLALICLNLVRFFVMVLLLILPESYRLYVVPCIAFISGFCNTLFTIGINSQLPNWITNSKRLSVNTWLTSLSSVSAVTGGLLVGTLIAGTGYENVFILNIIAYVFVAVMLLPLKKITDETQPSYQSVPFRQEWRQLKVELRKAPILAGMLLVTLVGSLGNAAHQVGFPIIAKLLTPENISQAMGILMASWAVGKFVGARLLGHLLKKSPYLSLERLFFVGFSILSIGFMLTFQQHQQVWAMLFVICAGIGEGIAEVSLVSRVQTEPDTLRLPVFSTLALFKMTGFAAGMMIVAPFYNWLPLYLVIMLFHGIPLITLVMVYIWLKRRLQPKKVNIQPKVDF
ncbi:MFS transporter [Marinomonas sp. RS-M-Aa-14]|uniref:MFS transporter n=1 Tax=Marinomonas sp. RS-M-Aa-14 TaxID=3241169 RepID=UPI00390C46A6